MKFKPVKKGTGTHKFVPKKSTPSTPSKRSRGGKYA